MKNIILGAIMGYDFDKLKPFVNSIKQTSYTGDVCLLHTQCSKQTIDSLESHGVIPEHFAYNEKGIVNPKSHYWKYIRPFLFKNNNFINRAILKKILPLQTVRFLYYNDFLKKNRNNYENVLLTDVRDVFFQEDPFNGLNENKINCYEEFLSIDEEKEFNQVWLEMLFGKKALSEMLQYKIVCSGTIIGPIDLIIEMLDDFENLILKSYWIAVSGSDQGAYNYLMYKYYKDRVKFNPFGTGNVLTLFSEEEKVYKIENDKIYYLDGTLVPVVHQYYRSNKITSLIEQKYYEY